MINNQVRSRFEALSTVVTDEAEALARDVKFGRPRAQDSLIRLAALFAHAAFVAPERIAATYDAAARGWGAAVDGPVVSIPAGLVASEPPRAAFWSAFWNLVDAAGTVLGPGEITARTAALGGHLSVAFQARAAAACLAYRGVAEAAAQGAPARFALADLALCPAGSLGGVFHRLIIDNGFDLEVLDRDALGLAGLPPPLDYINMRALQAHDLWHIVAGYRTTGLHEVAISAFQMAQFGHAYSAMFLAMAISGLALNGADFAPILLETILTAWAHGRRTPSLLGVPWEAVWNLPVETVRLRLGVTPYTSPYPADLFEAARAA